VFWQSTRGSLGVRLSDARGALVRARAVLSRGGAAAMMIDQVPSRRSHAVETDFLGRPVLVDRAPATLAASTGAPLVVAASRRDSTGDHVLQVLAVLEPPPRAGRAWAVEASVAATRALEAFVRDYPSQWLWMHRRWKRLDPAPAVGMLAARCKTPSSSPDAASRAA
jgi:Kdo2-lipid IVA lauroyltransferase/acyltransferase